jgi:cardiolipin synthase (CMP-forming)
VGEVEPGARRGEEVAPAPAGREGGGGPRPPDAGPYTLANAITLTRLLLAPLVMLLYVRGELLSALAVYALAATTDVFDGLAARLLDEHSRVGEILDPIADKLLAFCTLVALVAAGRLPAWLAALIIGRDVALVATATALQWIGRPVPIEPTRAGKYATAMLVALVLLVLAGDVGAAPRAALAPWVASTGLLVAACVTVSWAQYGRTLVVALARPGRLARHR